MFFLSGSFHPPFRPGSSSKTRRDYATRLAVGMAISVLILLAGCVTNRPYRLANIGHGIYEERYPGQKPSSEVHDLPGGKSYRLSFIEFDEKGDFWDRRQLAYAASLVMPRNKRLRKPVLLVMFIHGWHHNAADRNEGGDVQTFRALLSQLARSTSISGLQVHGVYLGWRGRLVQGPLDYFTFLGRKAAATRVAGTPVTETIFELIRQARRAGPGKSKTVVIGHSFGALVLEKAMAQAMAGSILSQDAEAHADGFNAPADLVLLVNSAAESLYAKQLSDMFRAVGHRGHVNSNQPLMVSITSETDDATSGWFPRGTFLPNLIARRQYQWGDRRGPTSDNVNQHEYLTTTPGHQRRLFTHEVLPLGDRPASTASIGDPTNLNQKNEGFEENLRHGELPHRNDEWIFATSSAADPSHLSWWKITPSSQARKDYRNRTPYWIMRVPPQIIHKHSPIFTLEGQAMMAALYRIANPMIQQGPRKMGLDEAARQTGPSGD